MLRTSFSIAVIVALTACTTAQDAAGPPAITRAELPRGCPLGVAGGHVWTEDTPTGIALTFVSKDRPEEMRARANDAAAQHGPGQKVGAGHEGRHGEGGTHGLQLLQAPPAYSVASDIEGGARIHLTAVDANDRDALRTKLRERAARMNEAPCK
jgi:hypothetical protein